MELRQEGALSTEQQQRIMLSPQMQQAIELMQLPVMELAAAIMEEAERNPLLEFEEEELDDNVDLPPEDLTDELSINFDDNRFETLENLDADYSYHFLQDQLPTPSLSLEERTPAHFSLFEQLLHLAPEATLLIGYLDDTGLLTTSLDEIALLENERVEQLQWQLWALQEAAPSGMGARNLRESYLLQLNERRELNTPCYQIVLRAWSDMLNNRVPKIAKELHLTPEQVHASIEHLSHLELHPAARYHRELDQTITPDLIIHEEDGELWPEVNTEPLPTLNLSQRYLTLLDGHLPAETRNYLQSKLGAGRWLRKCLSGRNDTLRRLGEYLIYAQGTFLSDPEGKLHPMTMLEIANALGLHESTIARAVSGKYLTCPRGTFSLRELFTRAVVKPTGERVSARSVKERLLEIISEESKFRPLSDAKIAEQLQLEGLPCARRTVAKYRHQLGVPPRTARRRFS